jgi:hypothetical protein
MVKLNIMMVLLDPDLNGATSLSNLNLPKLAGETKCLAVILDGPGESGDFLGGMPAILMMYLDSILLMQL